MLTPSRRTSLTLCLFAVAGALAYHDVLDDYFLSDDFDLIGRVLAGDLPFVWGRSHGGFFRPLFVLSYYLDAKVWGPNPVGFHLTNLLLHVINSFLVAALARVMLRDFGPAAAGREYFPLLAGFLFLLHPSHTEAVSWISGRVDLLVTLFCLASLLSYLSHLRTGRPAHLALALFSFLLALLTKEMAVCLPPAALAAGMYAERNRGGAGAPRRALKTAAYFLPVLAAYVALRAVILGALVGGYGAAQHLVFTHSVVVSQALRFAVRAVFPAVVLRSMPFLESRRLSPILIGVGAAVVLAAALLLARGRGRAAASAFARRHSFLWLLWLLFFCCLTPVLNLRINVFDTQGERFLYLPSVFSSAALAYLLTRPARRGAPAAALALSLSGFYFVTLGMTNRTWGEAAGLSRGIADETAGLSAAGPLIMLNVPDNVRGAYVFRNGFGEALGTFRGGGASRPAHVVAFHGLRTREDRVELSEAEGVFTHRLSSRASAFEKINPPPACVQLLDHSGEVLRFRLAGCEEAPDILFFSAGRVSRLRRGP